MLNSRYIVGIDLGTTNTCVSYIDTKKDALPRPFPILQLLERENWAALDRLPSFATYAEKPVSSPWQESGPWVVGEYAKSRAFKRPDQTVVSAKSWLCHPLAARKDPILPPDMECAAKRISPLQAQTLYLTHIEKAWNHRFAKNDTACELGMQQVVLTVPASYDEVARQLTLQAAYNAHLQHVCLLEEPQAAFYHWLSKHEKTWEEHLTKMSHILVCDIGGGTTDFSFLALQKEGLVRLCVGEHLLLGGDNMDLFLADMAEKEMKETMHGNRMQRLIHQARLAKESILQGAESFSLVVGGTGARVVAGSRSCELKKDAVEDALLKGFFPFVEIDGAYAACHRKAIMHTGLPYEQNCAITHHLARFLQNAGEGKPLAPDFVFFNGGTLKPTLFRGALMETLRRWFPNKTIKELASQQFDHAVARGAAYFGRVKRGEGVRIGGGTATSYYLGCQKDGKAQAIALFARGAQEGSTVQLPEVFHAPTNTPVRFDLYSSHTRLHDKSGDWVAIDEAQLQKLIGLQTVLKIGKDQKKIGVMLQGSLSEVGTLEVALKAKDTPHRFELSFEVRPDRAGVFLPALWQDACFDHETLKQALKSFSLELQEPRFSFSQLEQRLGIQRADWPLSLLRGFYDELMAQEGLRKTSPGLFWNMAGFFLRPGFGAALDGWRLKEFWRLQLMQESLKEEHAVMRVIACRRVASGFNRGQQMQLFSLWHKELLPLLQKGLQKKDNPYYFLEKMRAISSLELIDTEHKIRLGNRIVARMVKGQALDAEYWCLARLGAQRPLLATQGFIVPVSIVQKWLETLLGLDYSSGLQQALSMLFEKGIFSAELERRLQQAAEKPQYAGLRSIWQAKPEEMSRQEALFGEALPLGLQMNENKRCMSGTI